MLQRIQRIRCTKPTFEERRMIMTMKDYIQICKIIYKYKKIYTKIHLRGEEDAPTTSVDVQPPQLSSAVWKQSKDYSRKHFNYR